MSKVEVRDGIILLTDSFSSARIDSRHGALLTSYKVHGIETIFFTEEKGDAGQPLRGGNPLLFPACGRTQDKQYTLDGKRYPMNIHGFARDLPWETVETSEQGAARVVLALSSNSETKKQFPFDFRLEYTFELRGGELAITQETLNTDDKPFSFSCGMHPYFNADRDRARVYLPEELSFEKDTETDDVTRRKCASPVLDTGLSYSVMLTCSDDYAYYVIWSPAGAGFVCVEPWTASPNALNTGDDLTKLPAGERHSVKCTFTVK